ncbi:MAG: dihydrofolate reductase family protein [Chlamydiales bacterium]|nr:dihydrofolate reductase family protein [Chlamydiales bacterium]
MEKSIAKQSNSPKKLETTPLSRPKVSIYIASSIDGYIARTDGNLDWLHYGHVGDEDYGFKEFTNSIDAVVMGRNTYEVVAGFDEWAYKDKRVIVLSSTLTEVRKEAELFSGRPTELLAKLLAENIKHIWIDGGITVSRFLEAGLVDEITISIISMVLGSGIPLFSKMNQEHKCRLVSTQSYPSGLVQLKYEVLRGC